MCFLFVTFDSFGLSIKEPSFAMDLLLVQAVYLLEL